MDRPNGGGGNRPEPRARGNAPQLHEKYKAMARDAQLAGDRVQTEYYLQFADHYFRILNETRARFDEQRPQRGDNGQGDGRYDAQHGDGQDEYDDEDGEGPIADDEPVENGRYAPQRQPRASAPDRAQGGRSQNDRPQGERVQGERVQGERSGGAEPSRDVRPQRDEGPQQNARPDRQPRERPARSFEPAADVDEGEEDAQPFREATAQRARPPGDANGSTRASRTRSPRADATPEEGPGIELDRLPPAIARTESAADAVGDGGEDDRPRPVRRPRRPRETPPVAA